ncbi:MAG: manganese efflux pump MntP family protein [Bacteroidaceae bacterium]
MSELDCWLLGIALAMDCMAVSLTCGINQKRICWKQTLLMALFFGSFQAVMPIIGWVGTTYFRQTIEDYDHWIAFALLVFLGGKMIIESFKNKEENHTDYSKMTTIVLLSIATSIDALAVGISFNCLGMHHLRNIYYPILIIGFTSFILSVFGKLIGVIVGRRLKIKTELIGGTILILIAIKIIVNS